METGAEKEAKKEFGWFTRALAYRCEICPLCRFARNNPHTLFSRIMHWHGKYCPAWRAHVKVYDQGQS